jgi:hypothetical protein
MKLPTALAPLKYYRRFVLWKPVLRNGKVSKPPCDADGNVIDATNAKNWLTYRQACDALERWPTGWDGGIGFALQGSGIGALDLDHVRRAGGGDRINILLVWAHCLVKRGDSYTEITPSGEGLRVIGFADGEEAHSNWKMPGGGKLEVYRDTKRYITITGRRINDAPLRNINNLIDELLSEHSAANNKQTKQRAAAAPLDVGDGWRALARAFGVPIDRVTDPVRDGRRSTVAWIIGREMRRRGASPEQVATVLWASRCFRDKRGDSRAALREEVRRIFEKE